MFLPLWLGSRSRRRVSSLCLGKRGKRLMCCRLCVFRESPFFFGARGADTDFVSEAELSWPYARSGKWRTVHSHALRHVLLRLIRNSVFRAIRQHAQHVPRASLGRSMSSLPTLTYSNFHSSPSTGSAKDRIIVAIMSFV